MSYERMCAEEKRLDSIVSEWLRKAAEADEEEDELFGSDERGDEPPEWMKSKERRLAKIREAKAALEREAKEEAERAEAEGRRSGGEKRQSMQKTGKPPADAQRDFTDPDSKIMRRGKDYVQAYNCRAAVDAEAQVIVSRDVVTTAVDQWQLVPQLDQLRANLGRQASEVSADAGYCNESNLRELSRRRIRGYVATGRHRHGTSAPRSAKKYTGRFTQAMAERIRRGGRRSRCRSRKYVVEPVFGQIKECLGFRRFLLRGMEKVKGEWSLVCTAHNLRKLVRVM